MSIPLTSRWATATVAAVVLLTVVAACSGQSTPTGSAGAGAGTASTSTPSAVAYSACMRSHGVPNFPDPGTNGGIPKGDAQSFGVSSSQLGSAQTACRQMLPSTGGSFLQASQQCLDADSCSPAVVQQILTVQRAYSRCVRPRGFPNWPDPTIDAQGRPYFDVSGAGISSATTHSPQFLSVDRICEHLVGIHGNVPVDMG
jgi:hypothetical protein